MSLQDRHFICRSYSVVCFNNLKRAHLSSHVVLQHKLQNSTLLFPTHPHSPSFTGLLLLFHVVMKGRFCKKKGGILESKKKWKIGRRSFLHSYPNLPVWKTFIWQYVNTSNQTFPVTKQVPFFFWQIVTFFQSLIQNSLLYYLNKYYCCCIFHQKLIRKRVFSKYCRSHLFQKKKTFMKNIERTSVSLSVISTKSPVFKVYAHFISGS